MRLGSLRPETTRLDLRILLEGLIFDHFDESGLLLSRLGVRFDGSARCEIEFATTFSLNCLNIKLGSARDLMGFLHLFVHVLIIDIYVNIGRFFREHVLSTLLLGWTREDYLRVYGLLCSLTRVLTSSMYPNISESSKLMVN